MFEIGALLYPQVGGAFYPTQPKSLNYVDVMETKCLWLAGAPFPSLVVLSWIY